MEVLTPAEVYIAATDEGELPEIAAASLEASGVEKSRRNRKVVAACCCCVCKMLVESRVYQ